MRTTLKMGLIGTLLNGVILVQTVLAQSIPPKQLPTQTEKIPNKAPAKAKSTAIPAGDWQMYSRDLTSTRYSPLKQINTANVSQMRKVWSYRPTGPVADTPAEDNS